MTLILTVASPTAVYQSSDFQLTTPNGSVVSDADGTKQLQLTIKTLHLQLAFTGLARLGSVRTIDWLRDELIKHQTPNLATILSAVADRCEAEFKAMPANSLLTIVIAASDGGQGSTVARITNSSAGIISQKFTVSVTDIIRPVYFCDGYTACVTRDDRRRLKRLARRTDRPIHKALNALAEINASCAQRSSNRVSKGCWTSAQQITRGGVTWTATSTGDHGSVGNLVDGKDLAEYVQANWLPAPGQKIRLTSAAGATGQLPRPALFPEGEPRRFIVSYTSADTFLRSPAGLHFGTMRVSFCNSAFVVRRNESAIVPMEVSLKIANPIVASFSKWERHPHPRIEFPSIKIDGINVASRAGQHDANYSFSSQVLTLHFPQSSRSIRNVGFLADDEDLLLWCKGLNDVHMSHNEGTKIFPMEAVLWWRKRIDGTTGPPKPDDPTIISQAEAPLPVAIADRL